VAGLRYLTERDTTFIVEYYHNGAGYFSARQSGSGRNGWKADVANRALNDIVAPPRRGIPA
jgi:hypothetical protein